jgi:hypothetical protein
MALAAKPQHVSAKCLLSASMLRRSREECEVASEVALAKSGRRGKRKEMAAMLLKDSIDSAEDAMTMTANISGDNSSGCGGANDVQACVRGREALVKEG